MIAIRTNHDVQTNYLYEWSESLIKEAELKGFNVARMEGKNITEKVLRSRIQNRKPSFIFFNGHGNAKSIFNNENKPFIDISSSDVFDKTVTFARACDCLKELGKDAVKKGCNSFIGYKNNFWIVRHHKFECVPLKDEVARPILECSNIIVEELIKGNTVDQAVKKSHEKSADYILELIYSKEPLAIASLQAIVTNDAALDFEGIDSAKIG